MTVIAYHHESRPIADHCAASCAGGADQRLVRVSGLPEAATRGDEIVIIGRGGNTHDSDIDHIRTVRAIRGTPARDLSVVCFDWHHDVDNELGGTELTAGSWVFYGLEHDLFANACILGANPRIDHEAGPATGQVQDEDSMLLRVFDRLRLYTGVRGTARLRYDPMYEPSLLANPSVDSYEVAADGRSVGVTYKTWRDTSYDDPREYTFVSIDVDVLAESEIRSDCPQGVWSLADLLEAVEQVRSHTTVVGWSICGMDLAALDEHGLSTVATIIHTCRR